MLTPSFAFRSPVLLMQGSQPKVCSQIPDGARRAPRPLLDRLESLQFGYESKQVESPGCIRYICRNGHTVTGFVGSAACERCPTCDFSSKNPCRRPLCIPKLQMVARERGGTLLSKVYVNSREPLLWKCAKGHQWAATADNIRRRQSWCRECANVKKRDGIEEMQKLARKFGGECLSETYVTSNMKLKWRCAEGHVFEMAPNNIKRKPGGKRKPSWCTKCKKSGIKAVPVIR